MPIYPPRTEPIKKQEELTKKHRELTIAIEKNISAEKLIKFVEKYRQAQLSMLKAKIHQFKENEFQNKQNSIKIEKVEKLIIEWMDKTNNEIISEVKKHNTH